MATFLLIFGLSFAIVGLSVLGLSAGVLGGRKPLKGSCGGIADGTCSTCAGCTRAHRPGERQSRGQRS